MRQNIVNKHRLSENEMRSIQDQKKAKHLFPKLKSHSHDGRTSFSFVELKGSVRSRLLCEDFNGNHHQRSLSRSKEENNRAAMLKYHYVNKSPNYFKNLSKSIQSENVESNNIQRDSHLIDSGDKALIKPELVDLINSRVNNNVMKNPSGNVVKNKNLHEKSQTMVALKGGSFVIQKTNTKNSLTKSKAQYDKIRAFILFEKYAKNMDDRSKEFYIPSKENQQKRKASLQPLQYSTSSFYDTQYSNFEANSLLPLKSQLKSPKNNSYQKLDLYRFQ